MMKQMIVVGLLLLSGCLSAGPQDEAEDPQRGPWSVGYDAEDCRLVVAVVQRPLDEIAPFLPAGYTPADAQGLLGTPEATGNAAVLVGVYRCGSGELEPSGLSGMELNIYIEPPHVPGERPAADSDFYLMEVATETEALAVLLEEVEWTVTRASIDVDMDALPGGLLAGEASVESEGRDLVHVDGYGAVESALSGLSRFWHATPPGASYFEFVMAAEARVGAATCTLASGTTAATMVGGTQCPLGDTVGITVHGFDWRSTFHHLPGVEVE